MVLAASLAAALLFLMALAAFVYLLRRSRAALSDAAAAVALERDWFDTTIATIGDGIITTDRAGRIALLNPVAQALTGWSEQAARGLPVADVLKLVNEETRELIKDPVAKVLEKGIAVGMANHSVLVAKDGTERPIDDSATPIHDAQGNIKGIIFVFRDVTARRKAETLRFARRAAARWLMTIDPQAGADHAIS